MSWDYLVFPEKIFCLHFNLSLSAKQQPTHISLENDPCFDEPAIEQQQI